LFHFYIGLSHHKPGRATTCIGVGGSHKFASEFNLCEASKDLLRGNIRFDSIPSKKLAIAAQGTSGVKIP